MQIYANQLGYDRTAPKRAVIGAQQRHSLDAVRLVDATTGDRVREVTPTFAGPVADWDRGVFWTVSFDDWTDTGTYYLAADGPDGDTVRSRRFEVGESVHRSELLSDLVYSVTAMRSRDQYDRADRQTPFVGQREDTVDAHGGWYDASADQSKYLSHLSYANYWNPQQTPLAVWAFLDARDHLLALDGDAGEHFEEQLRAEACYGADFLCRMHDDEGYFYMTLFDGWSHDPDRREICAFRDRDGRKTADYEAGYRQGGGMAIAALARASTVEAAGKSGTSAAAESDASATGESDAGTYLDHAIEGFDHLERHNEAYLDDGTENVIDDYCALLAATELFDATAEERFRRAATERAAALLDRQTADDAYAGWWRADDEDRPFFHAVDEGLPVVALLRYRDVVGAGAPTADDRTVGDALADYWSFQRAVTTDVPNPFGYARQYAVTADGDRRASFFMPQDNETGYWWLGENSRLASLAAAAWRTADRLGDHGSIDGAWLDRFARDQVNWILGANPYDCAMVRGVGGPTPDFHPTYRGVPGGVCNGVTAAVGDPDGIAFNPEPQADDMEERWRWSEQWLPHAVWLALAVAAADSE